MKVYDKFMYATSNIFKKFKASITFLIPIVIGIVLGFALGFLLVKTLLDLFPFVTICLFVGLMVGTFPILFKEIKGKKNETNKIPLFILGVILPIFISVISIFLANDKDITSVNILHYLLFIAIGILVSLTQLIPGLSATVLLMIFGYYKFLIDGVSIDLLNDVNLILIYLSLAMGFLIGTLMIVIIDYYISKKDITNDQYNKSNILLVLAVVIHNIPEGLAIGVTFGSLAIGIDNVTLSGALLLTLGIGLQNLPEGAAISMPLATTGMKKSKAYLIGALSAIVEPIAAILGTLLVLSMRLFLPLMLLIAAAIMIFVVVDEIVPMANSYNKRLTSIGFIIGFIIMMILDLAFK